MPSPTSGAYSTPFQTTWPSVYGKLVCSTPLASYEVVCASSPKFQWFTPLGVRAIVVNWLFSAGRSVGASEVTSTAMSCVVVPVGLGTGWIEPVKGGAKLTLELGQLGIDTRGLEVYSGPERATAGMVRPLTGKCTGTFRMRLDTAQGSATKAFRC